MIGFTTATAEELRKEILTMSAEQWETLLRVDRRNLGTIGEAYQAAKAAGISLDAILHVFMGHSLER